MYLSLSNPSPKYNNIVIILNGDRSNEIYLG